MPRIRARALCTFAIAAIAISAAIAPSASANPSDLLAGHGNFEKPVIGTTIRTYSAGATFDGWKVRAGKVSLFRPFPGAIVPPQGKQALALVNVNGSHPGGAPGTVCRTIATIAEHLYNVAFKATVADQSKAQVVAKLGASSKSVQLPAGSFPAVWKQYHVTLPASATNARFCMAAAKVGPGAAPAIDALKVTDLGL